MHRSGKRGPRALAAAVLCLTATAAAKVPAPASVAAAPWAIIAYGPLLGERVVIADWHENYRLMIAAPWPGTATDARVFRGRARVEVALFWGPEWVHLARSRDAAARLRVDQANQRAWLFPARGDEAAVFVLDPPVEADFATTLMARAVGPDGLAMLAAHGVPVRVDR
jgi:hypothetical protein